MSTPRDPGVRKLIRYNEKTKTTREMRITPLTFVAKPARHRLLSPNIFLEKGRPRYGYRKG
jgi:hypothetical protein